MYGIIILLKLTYQRHIIFRVQRHYNFKLGCYEQSHIISFHPPSFAVILANLIWNSFPLDCCTFLPTSFPKKFIFFRRLYFFPLFQQFLWAKAKPFLLLKWIFMDKGTFQAILPGRLARDSTTLQVSLEIALEDLKGSRFRSFFDCSPSLSACFGLRSIRDKVMRQSIFMFPLISRLGAGRLSSSLKWWAQPI